MRNGSVSGPARESRFGAGRPGGVGQVLAAAGERSGALPADREVKNLVAIPLYLVERFQGVVACANRAGGFEELDDNLLLALGDHAGAALRTQRLQNEINDAHRGATRMLAGALEAHDPLRRREAGQAAMLARGLCRRLGLDPREQGGR